MIDINKNFTYDYIIFNVKNEDDFNILLKSFELNKSHYNYSDYEDCINNGGFVCLCPKDGGVYYMSKHSYGNVYNDVSFYPEVIEISKSILYNLVHFIKTGQSTPDYKPKGKLIRENVLNEIVKNNKYGFTVVVIGIYDMDDINYMKENQNKYGIYDTIISSIKFNIEHNVPSYIRFSIYDIDDALSIGWGNLSNLSQISRMNNFTYEKVFTVDDVKKGVFNNIIKFGNSIIKPNYVPKKIVRENVLKESINKKYGFTVVVIGIYDMDDINYMSNSKYNDDDIMSMVFPMMKINICDNIPSYMRFSILNDNITYCGYGKISQLSSNSRLNNFTYDKVFTVDDIKNGLFDDIIKYGVYPFRPNYVPKKIVRESVKVLRFDELDNIEYRKGSKKFGGLILKLMEFLRIHKDKELNNLEFTISDFENESNIDIQEIKDLISDDKGKNLYRFDIEITDDKIIFSDLTTDKNRYFESFDTNIRHNYELLGVEDYYKKVGHEYINPHLDNIKESIIEINDKDIVDFSNVLDLASGKGEVTNILKELGYTNIIGTDPYLFNEYMKETGKKCYTYSFQDIQKGKLDNKKYSTIVCSYAMHLSKPSIIPTLLWKLSLISNYLIIISPNNNPEIKENSGWVLIDNFKKGKCKVRVFTSQNMNI